MVAACLGGGGHPPGLRDSQQPSRCREVGVPGPFAGPAHGAHRALAGRLDLSGAAGSHDNSGTHRAPGKHWAEDLQELHEDQLSPLYHLPGPDGRAPPPLCPGRKWAEEQLVWGPGRQEEAGKEVSACSPCQGPQGERFNPKLGLGFFIQPCAVTGPGPVPSQESRPGVSENEAQSR